MTSVAIAAVGFAAIITIGCVLAEAYDRLARKWGWPR